MADLFRFNPDLAAVLDKHLAAAKPEKRDPTWADVEAAFASLRAGNAIFADELSADPKDTKRPDLPDLNKAWRRDIANDHEKADDILPDSPRAAILCCSDHRASPELVFWQGLGRVFVIRDAGNLLDDNGAASLEYAVRVLKVPLIVVLGHEGCGAVDAAIDTFTTGKRIFGTKLPGLVERFRDLWDAMPDNVPVKDAWLCEKSLAQTKAAIEQIPLVVVRLGTSKAKGNLAVVTARYELLSGRVTWVDTGPLSEV